MFVFLSQTIFKLSSYFSSFIHLVIYLLSAGCLINIRSPLRHSLLLPRSHSVSRHHLPSYIGLSGWEGCSFHSHRRTVGCFGRLRIMGFSFDHRPLHRSPARHLGHHRLKHHHHHCPHSLLALRHSHCFDLARLVRFRGHIIPIVIAVTYVLSPLLSALVVE